MKRRGSRVDLPIGANTSLRVAAVAGAGVLVAALTSSGTPYIPPSWWPLGLGAILAVVATTLVAARGADRFTPWIALIASAGAGIAAGHVLFRAGMPRVHDILHVWGIWAYGRCFAEGSVIPLWTPHLGAGIPLLPFYGALNFLLALPGIVLGLAPVDAWKLEMLSGHVLASVSLLAAARMLGAGWGASVIAAAAGAFAPWRLAVVGYRGALGEANAFIFMPLVAGAGLRLLRRPTLLAGFLFSVGTIGLILTHPVSLFTLAITMAPVAVVWLAVPMEREPGEVDLGRGLISLVLAITAAAGLAAVAWIPIVAEQRHTAVRETTEDNPFYRYGEQGVAPAALFERRAWDRQRVAIPETARRERGLEGQQMPFYAGLTLTGLALTAGWWSSKKRCWALSAGVVLALVLSTSGAAHLVGAWPPFPTLRFPWRFLSPATVVAALAVALGADAGLRRRNGWRWAIPCWIAISALVWDAAPFTGAADWIPPYDGIVHWWEREPRAEHWPEAREAVPVQLPEGGDVLRVYNLEMPPTDYRAAIDSFYPGYYEWLTPEIYRRYWRAGDPGVLGAAGVRLFFAAARKDPVQIQARPYASLEMPDGSRTPVSPARWVRLPGRITVEAEAPQTGAVLVALEQAFPGWVVRIGRGDRSPPSVRDGFLSVSLPPGRSLVEFRYGMGTPPRRAGLAFSAATVLALAAGAVFARRNARRQG